MRHGLFGKCEEQLATYYVRSRDATGVEAEREVSLGAGKRTDPWSWIASQELRDAWGELKSAGEDASVVATWRNDRAAPTVGLLRPGKAPVGEAKKALLDVFTQAYFCSVQEEAARLYTAPAGVVPMEPVGLWTFSREDRSLTSELFRVFTTGEAKRPPFVNTVGDWGTRKQYVIPWIMTQMAWGADFFNMKRAGPLKLFTAGYLWSASKVQLSKLFRGLGLAAQTGTWQNAWGGTEHVVHTPERRSIQTFSFDNVGMKVEAKSCTPAPLCAGRNITALRLSGAPGCCPPAARGSHPPPALPSASANVCPATGEESSARRA